MTQTIIDHLVIGAAELDKATKQIQSFIKAEFLAGGKHPLMATHNRLIKLQKSIYMEIIAADPSASLPRSPKEKTAGFRLTLAQRKRDFHERHSHFVGLLLSMISNKLRCIVDTILATSLK